MTGLNLKIIAVVLVLAGIGGIFALSQQGSPRDHVLRTYEVVTRGDVRRAKLYYLRDLQGKAAKIKEKRVAR